MSIDILVTLVVFWYALCGWAIWLGINYRKPPHNSLIYELLFFLVVVFWLPIVLIGAPFLLWNRLTK